MASKLTDLITFERGYIPTQSKASGIPGSIIDGLNCYVRGGGLIESSNGFGSAGSTGASVLMNVGSTHGGTSAGGTVIQFYSTYWFINGTAYVGGSSIGASGGSLMLVSGSAVAAGLTAPSAPTIAASATAGKNNGSYSIALTAIRSTTGAESSRSLPSNVVAVKNKKITVTFPAVPTGANKWGIYGTRRGFGSTGGWFHLTDVNTGSATLDFDWFDGELGDQAPIDFDPPPTGTHCFAIDNVMVVAGSYGGYGLSPSIPGKPEAFPPDFTSFLPRGENITACKGSGVDGAVLIASANSLNEVVRGGPDVPILPRPMWPSTGFVGGSSFCIVDGQIYGLSGTRGAVRGQIGGSESPDSTFARDVQSEFATRGFTSASAVVGFDPKNDAIWFCSGSIGIPFMRSLGVWSTPMTLPGSATTCATVSGQLLISVGGTLYTPEAGSGSTWHAIPAWRDAGAPEYMKTITGVRAAGNAAITLDVLTNLSTSSVQTISAGSNHSDWTRTNIRNAKSYTVKASGTSGGQSPYELAVQAIPHRVSV